jgi:glycine/serine hydroxymethyltransferase
MGPAEMEVIGGAIARILEAPNDAAVEAAVRAEVAELCAGFPLR